MRRILPAKITAPAPSEDLCPQHGIPYEIMSLSLGEIKKEFRTCAACQTESAKSAEQEEARRREQIRNHALMAAKIPARFSGLSLDSFQASSDAQRSALQHARDFVNAPATGLLFLGSCGTGKTHLACAILQRMIDRSGDGLYVTTMHAVRRVKQTYRNTELSEQAAIDSLVKPYLLVIDEVGVQHGSDTERLILTEIINERYGAERPTIMIANLTMAEFTQTLGERVVDRFREGGRVVVFDWPSYRPQKYRMAEQG